MDKFYVPSIFRNAAQRHADVPTPIVLGREIAQVKEGSLAFTHSRAKSQVTLPTRHAAILLFHEAIVRLLDVNQWNQFCTGQGLQFRLSDAAGRSLDLQRAYEGQFICVTPQADSVPTMHFEPYWIRIDNLEQKRDLLKDEELFGFRGSILHHPKQRPAETQQETYISFLIIRNTSTVTVLERGRHALPYTWSNWMLHKMKEFLGIVPPVWKHLVEGLIHGRPE